MFHFETYRSSLDDCPPIKERIGFALGTLRRVGAGCKIYQNVQWRDKMKFLCWYPLFGHDMRLPTRMLHLAPP